MRCAQCMRYECCCSCFTVRNELLSLTMGQSRQCRNGPRGQLNAQAHVLSPHWHPVSLLMSSTWEQWSACPNILPCNINIGMKYYVNSSQYKRWWGDIFRVWYWDFRALIHWTRVSKGILIYWIPYVSGPENQALPAWKEAQVGPQSPEE